MGGLESQGDAKLPTIQIDQKHDTAEFGFGIQPPFIPKCGNGNLCISHIGGAIEVQIWMWYNTL